MFQNYIYELLNDNNSPAIQQRDIEQRFKDEKFLKTMMIP